MEKFGIALCTNNIYIYLAAVFPTVSSSCVRKAYSQMTLQLLCLLLTAKQFSFMHILKKYEPIFMIFLQ